MRKRAPAVLVCLLSLSGCWRTDPDYVAMTRPPQCDVRSRLVRRGFPENLDAVLAGACTVTRMDPMRGPDFTRWLAGTSSAIMTCDSLVPIPFWTEKSPEGKITKVHFCPEYCEDLRITLEKQIVQDLICEEDAGQRGVAGATLPPSSGTVAPPYDAGAAFPRPAAGTGGVAAASGGSGALGGSAGAPVTGGAAGAAGTAAFAGAGGTAGANGIAGAAGTSGVGGSG